MHAQHSLLDLPDEILLMVFKALQMVDVLYCLAEVNQRLNRIAHDFLYTRQLDLTGLSTLKYRCNHISLTAAPVLSHFSQKTLPRIHDQVHRMAIEPYLMRDMIGAANYPQLYSLSLRNFQDEFLYRCLTGMLVDIL